MPMPDNAHAAVMLDETLEGLRVRADGVYLDGTFGRGGHAQGVLERLGAHGRLLLMDRDPEAVAAARRNFASDARVAIRHGNFAEIADWDATLAGLDGVLLDLGVSSPQLDDAARGFSFRVDAPLDMRMDPTHGMSAAEFLARADEREIADVLWNYGEERMSRRIARAIVAQRRSAPIARTGELADLIAGIVGRPPSGKHPATRSFQALRIAVNGEMDALEKGLRGAVARLRAGGRLCVISFHSLEDRVVKQFLRDQSQAPAARRGLPPVQAAALSLRLIGHAQMPGEAELARNPRARSAVLRVAEKLA
ncbi:MAG: 16S rRNA (cytosine(1402)-N(4))-methyltransferase RsmH [Xanthomonadaceae bacterium]|nr:16S rRNA (cytosine(1402)-N(4))-methyltransferase RsmH [Xanthomonadaceae bacterium]MDE1885124.1 16S rRNA (cytosine(1402)-N(4))-methyltransferase RsmH [Xanthomonadaceae bacterium]MDE1961356.1 16S rRNA (cytosine(1402)-N(4))-methyltransferase RsmH [Xanthomonadaceae bacterium]MDE2084313.1 16S rRNA (cytosine(1402)-N(4))-methyltransferase RsmH [Xanthomonadaceae bacterium]MDE2257838.1 16S rRNA (cytosine(1402)-N(4))-methyltransferase RsmH [Xanthomonadaceae bacterium]